MSSSRRLDRPVSPARVVLLITLIVAGGSCLVTLHAATKVLGSAASLYDETLETVQDRLFGAAYMDSIRRLRKGTGAEDTIYLVDAQPRQEGASFFVVNWLAPRRLILLGSLRDDSLDSLRHRLPGHARWVVMVGEGQVPPVLQTAAEFRAP